MQCKMSIGSDTEQAGAKKLEERKQLPRSSYQMKFSLHRHSAGDMLTHTNEEVAHGVRRDVVTRWDNTCANIETAGSTG